MYKYHINKKLLKMILKKRNDLTKTIFANYTSISYNDIKFKCRQFYSRYIHSSNLVYINFCVLCVLCFACVNRYLSNRIWLYNNKGVCSAIK